MSLLDTIDNLYERLVAEEIEAGRQADDSEDFLQDVMCVALNRLPPRYYRHSVDMMFYLADQEQQEMHDKVKAAVEGARAFVQSHQRE
ncbi:MAG: late competence development ComFB family protein [Marinobacter sp.]|nr:late competence development ComFB family protein [Marinobacter sp.]